MSKISDAVSESARAAVVGYKVTKGDYSLSSPNLPQRIAILSEANTDKQTGLSLDPFEATNLKKVAEKLGAGSPAYMAMRILRPISGGGLSGIPTVIYPVETASGATASVTTVTITGTATKTQKHTMIIAGRPSLDGQSYSVTVKEGDTAEEVAAKFIAAINAVYGCPVTAAAGTSGVFTLTSKWKGISSVFITRAELNGDDAGLTYVVSPVAGTLTGDVATALGKFEGNWNTIVINPYGADSDVLDTLESFNGIPDPDAPTGRYQGIVFKPFIALFSKSTTDPVTDVVVTSRASQCTNVYCPAPNVKHLPVEVAANVARLVATIAQNSPNLDVNDKAYPDAIVDSEVGIGDYSDYEYRDEAVKAGLSTVDHSGGDVIIKDLVTTYNPTDEVTPQFKYVRNLILDWNIRYAYRLLEAVNVVGHTLVPDGTVVSAGKTISPAQWKGILYKMFEDLADRGLIADADFSKESLMVAISSTNPDRFETFFRYKRTGIARICSTTAEAGFYYGGQ
jgi:phage tail sheath gpL-like